MKDVAAAIVIYLLVYVGAIFCTFEPDMTRWTENGRVVYLIAGGAMWCVWKIFQMRKED